MILAKIRRSNRNYKKYEVIVTNGKKTKTIRFGDRRYQDYTIHKNPIRKLAYETRHSKRENWGDPFTAGFWSKWLLWNKPTIDQSLKDIKKRFGIIILP